MTSRKCLVAGRGSCGRRRGRGFSRGELKEAGTTIKQALQADVTVDKRRRSVHNENVELLRTQLQSLVVAGKRAPKSKNKSKKG